MSGSNNLQKTLGQNKEKKKKKQNKSNQVLTD